jgi:hypothetical protein
MLRFSAITFNQSSRRPTIMVHTGPIVSICLPSLSRRRKPRSTGFCHRDALRQRKANSRIDAGSAVGGFLDRRNPGTRHRNLDDHIGRESVEFLYLLHDSLGIAIQSRICLYRKPSIAAALRFENRPVAVGDSSMSAWMRSFQKLISFFKTPCTMTGLHVAPTAPCSLEYLSSWIEAESFHRQVGAAWVISWRGLL